MIPSACAIGRLVTIGLDNMDSSDIGTVLLGDLRSAAQSSDPRLRLFGMFVRERVLRGPSHADLLDPATLPISATIDLTTVQLLGWVGIRDYIAQMAQATSEQPDTGSVVAGLFSELPTLQFAGVLASGASDRYVGGRVRGLVPPLLSSVVVNIPRQLAAQPSCSAAFGNEDVTCWVNWVANKLGGGIRLPGMSQGLPGLTEVIQKQLGYSESVIKTTSKRLAWANAFTSAPTLAMQLMSLDVSGYEDPDPLERTKRTSDGIETTIYCALSLDPGKLPEGDNGAACFLSFLANMFGISFSFPAEGRISGAEMNFRGGEGFPDLVLFGDYKQLRQDTDANGEAFLTVIGRAQKQELPESANPVDKEFSILVSAQPEAVNGNTIANISFGGLKSGVAPTGAGAAGSLIDVLKTFTWDLGEHVFHLTDWKSPGFRYYFNSQGVDVKEGIICSFEKPFAINAKLTYPGLQGTYRYDFTPTSSTAGTVVVSGSFTSSGGRLTMQGSGTYKVLSPDTETPLVSVLLKELNTKGSQGYGQMIPAVPGAGSELAFDLEPLQTNECDGES